MNHKDFEIADEFCKEALKKYDQTIALTNNYIKQSKWIEDNKSLFEAISIKNYEQMGMCKCIFEDKYYSNISLFHKKYLQVEFEENILKHISIEEAILHFFERMNIDKIDKLLPYKSFRDFEKSQFIELLSNAFNLIKSRGNTLLKITNGKCNSCLPGHKAYHFEGDKDGSYFNLLLEIENEAINDIYECHHFLCDKKLENKGGGKVSIDTINPRF